MSQKSKEFSIRVPGTNFEIKSNTIYTIKPKLDPNAPDGFKTHGTTKVIHPAVGDTISAPFNTAMGVWDTGFYEHSPCLRSIQSDTEKTDFINKVKEHIVKPVEEIKGEGVLKHTADNTFYDEFVVTLANKIAFNTAEPLQLLGLYISVLGKQLAPSDESSNPAYKHASYVVVNRAKEISSKEQSTIDSSKAMGEFYYLLKDDKSKLLKIFKYLRISDTIIADDNTFITVFDRFLNDREDGYRNGKLFLEHIEKFNTEAGKQELDAFQMLHDLYQAKIVKVVKKEFYLKNINLGNSLKHAATKVVSDKDLHRNLIEISADLEASKDQE